MIGYIVFRLFIYIIGILPWRLMYLLSDMLAWILRTVIRYRIDIIKKNLVYALPALTPSKLDAIIQSTYKNLTDIILESLKSYTVSLEEINKRYRCVNINSVQSHYSQGLDVTLFAGHYTNWEWGTLTLETQLPYHIIGLIKPIKNTRINEYIWKERSKVGTGLVSIYDRKKSELHTNHETPKGVVFIADQNPSKASSSFDVNFLGKPTKALHGGEAYARKYQTPVYFLRIERIKRGFYTITPVLITENVDILEEGQLTQMFFDVLGEQITLNPAPWLWTHKRWKREGIYK